MYHCSNGNMHKWCYWNWFGTSNIKRWKTSISCQQQLSDFSSNSWRNEKRRGTKLKKIINDQLKINQRDFETINNLIDEDIKELQNSFNDKREIPIFSKIFISDNINPDDNQSMLHVETKEKFDVKMNANKIIKMWLLTHYQIRKYLILLF